MSTGGRKITYIQCQECGQTYEIPYEVEIDKLYVIADCPNCGISKGLNLGDKKEDLYYFYNESLDPRYY